MLQRNIYSFARFLHIHKGLNKALSKSQGCKESSFIGLFFYYLQDCLLQLMI